MALLCSNGASSRELTTLDASQVDLDTALTLVREGSYTFFAVQLAEDTPLATILRRATAPLLLVRGDHFRLQRVLFVLRGYASDDFVLEWAAPCLHGQPVGVTLLPLTSPSLSSLSDLLYSNGPAREHLDACVRWLDQANVRATLKLRQGDPTTQVADELAQGDYDLLVIAAEGRGAFVGRVLDEIEQRGVFLRRPVLVVKPPAALGHLHTRERTNGH